jgi:hypothetical protein
MRGLIVICIVFAATVDTPARADDEVKKQAEVKWARGVADDFLKALKKRDSANVEALLVPEYAKLLKDRTPNNPEPADAVYDRTMAFDKWTVTFEEISPDRDEAVFKGELKSASATRPFVLRVVKDKALGRWRVGLVSAEDEEPATKAKDSKE